MIVLVSGDYVVTNEFLFRNAVSDEIYIVCDTSSGPVNVTLPKINQEYMNGEFYISYGSSNAATNNINVLVDGTDLINGASGIVLNTDNACCSIFVASSSDTGDGVTTPKSMWIAASSQSGGGGGSYTSNNGLNLVGTTFKLGGTLSQNTTIDNGAFQLLFQNANISDGALTLLNTLGFAGGFITQLSSTNTVAPILKLQRSTTGSAADGIGGAIDMWVDTSGSGFSTPATAAIRQVAKWDTANLTTRKSSYELWGVYNGTQLRYFSLGTNRGQLILDRYGSGSFVDTPAYYLGVDASGNVIEFVGGGGFTSADNGLTANTSTNVQLGGTLLASTTILNNGFDFVVSRNTVGGDAIKGVGTGGVGVRGQSTSSAGVVGSSSSNAGVSGVSTTGLALSGLVSSTTNNDIKTILRLINSNATPSDGIGAAIDFFAGTSFSPQVLAGKLGLLWTDVNNSTRKSKFFVSNVNNGLEENKLEVESTGQIIFNKYGINTFTGTPDYLLGVDVSGNVVETTSIAARNYGSFYDTTIQIASGVGQADAMMLNSTDVPATNGISIVNDSFGNPTEITVTKASIYNIQFSAQLNRVGGGVLRQISIWLRKNGLNVTNTNTHISVQSNSNKVVAAWNFVISLNAGDNVQLMWSVEDIDIELLYEAENLLVPHPATPSVILTITEV